MPTQRKRPKTPSGNPRLVVPRRKISQGVEYYLPGYKDDWNGVATPIQKGKRDYGPRKALQYFWHYRAVTEPRPSTNYSEVA